MHGSSSPTRPLPRHLARFVRGSVLILFAFIALATCGKNAVEVIPASGVIEVTALTDGSGPFPDSFRVSINGGESGAVPANGSLAFGSLPRGNYLVALVEEGENLWYGVNARTVTVVPNDTTFTTFLIRYKAK